MEKVLDEQRLTGVAALLMTLVLLWSGVLAIGFAWSAIAGSHGIGFGKRTGFGLVAVFLALLSVRTGYEMVRRLRRSRALRR